MKYFSYVFCKKNTIIKLLSLREGILFGMVRKHKTLY